MYVDGQHRTGSQFIRFTLILLLIQDSAKSFERLELPYTSGFNALRLKFSGSYQALAIYVHPKANTTAASVTSVRLFDRDRL
jgi:hypothetical protein